MSLTYFTNIYIPPPWPQSYQSLLSWSLLPSCPQTLNCRQIKHKRGAFVVISLETRVQQMKTSKWKKVRSLKILYFFDRAPQLLSSLPGHWNHCITMGCLSMNTSIFVPSSREGLTSAVCPVFIFLSLSRPLSGPESPAL